MVADKRITNSVRKKLSQLEAFDHLEHKLVLTSSQQTADDISDAGKVDSDQSDTDEYPLFIPYDPDTPDIAEEQDTSLAISKN